MLFGGGEQQAMVSMTRRDIDAEAKAGKRERFEGAPRLAPRRRLDEIWQHGNADLADRPEGLAGTDGQRKMRARRQHRAGPTT